MTLDKEIDLGLGSLLIKSMRLLFFFFVFIYYRKIEKFIVRSLSLVTEFSKIRQQPSWLRWLLHHAVIKLMHKQQFNKSRYVFKASTSMFYLFIQGFCLVLPKTCFLIISFLVSCYFYDSAGEILIGLLIELFEWFMKQLWCQIPAVYSLSHCNGGMALERSLVEKV